MAKKMTKNAMMVKMNQLTHNDEACEDVAGVRYPVGQAVKLLVKRSLDRIVNLRFLKHLAHFSGVANFQHAHHPVALHDFSAAQNVIRRIGGLFVKMSRVDGLCAQRLAGERRFIHTERNGVKQLAVGRNLIAGVEDDDVAYHHILTRYGGHGAVAHHLNKLIVVYLIENFERLVGFLLKDERQRGCKTDGHEDADRLKEHLPVFFQAEILIK